ncbi:MAG: long-chain fatty acid--CoA ligase [Acidobacteria bacterium]|nr:MAG: long-chain fatty acid--CoA ligase [Acidobacteriota bacterium]
MPDITIVPDLAFKSIPKYNKLNCLMVKRDGVYANISAKEVLETIESLSAYLQKLGVAKGDRVGILAETRAEWAYADMAILSAGAITVPIYSTLPAKQAEYIIKDSEMQTLFVSTEAHLKKIQEIAAEIPFLKTIILFDSPAQMPAGIQIIADCIKEGKEHLKSDPEMVRKRVAEIKPDDVFTFVYTSGTTGEPKGVMLTHNNIISNITSIIIYFQFKQDDLVLSFLPLSHVFERMAGYYSMLYVGCTIAYAESVETIARNMLEVRPTLFLSVPRVYEKFYQRIMDNGAALTGISRKMFDWGMKVGAEFAEAKMAGKKPSATLQLKWKLANELVYKNVRKRLGGRLRLLVSGGAALPRQLGLFFYGIGLTILEGYGLTETSPVIAANRPDAVKFGTVGQPIPHVEVKIAEDGEILTRGPHVMKGYFKKPQQTSEAINADGWFQTGDIGEIDSEGFLRITDRKKDLIATSGGKKIAPQFVENALKTSKYIAQIVVVGEKRKFPSALIVPNMDNLNKFASANQIPEAEILTHPKVIQEVENDIDRLSTDLAPFERVKKVALLPHEFTIESGELTPSLKVKRNVVEKKYKDVIDALYG